MSSAICFNLDQSKILSSGNGLNCVALGAYSTHFPRKPTDFRSGYLQVSTNCSYSTLAFNSLMYPFMHLGEREQNGEIQKLTPAPVNRTQDLMITKPTLYLTTTDTNEISMDEKL